MQKWTFAFAAVGAIASVVKILEYFGIKPGGRPVSPEIAALLWGLIFISLSVSLAWTGYVNGKMKRQLAELAGGEGPLVIHSALYASSSGGQDVTDVVRLRVRDNRVSFVAGTDVFGDPCPNQFKHLTVDYSHAGKRLTRVVPEGNWCTLP